MTADEIVIFIILTACYSYVRIRNNLKHVSIDLLTLMNFDVITLLVVSRWVNATYVKSVPFSVVFWWKQEPNKGKNLL